MSTGLRSATLLLPVAVVASLVILVAAECTIDWNRPNQLKIRNSQYEVRFSGAGLRIFALMPSGRPYEEEFAQFELYSYQMVNGYDPFVATNLTAETLVVTRPCVSVFSSEIRTDPASGRPVLVDSVSVTYTLDSRGSRLTTIAEVFNDTLVIMLPDNINATVNAADMKFSFSMSIKSYNSPSEYLFTKQKLSFYTPYSFLAQFTDLPYTYLDPARNITAVSSTSIALKNINVTSGIQLFVYVDDELWGANTWSPLRNGQSFFGDGYYGGVFWNTWKYHNRSIDWDPSLSVLFTGQEPPYAADDGPRSGQPTSTANLVANEANIVAIVVPIVAVLAVGAVAVFAFIGIRRRRNKEQEENKKLAKRLDSLAEMQKEEQRAKPALNSSPSSVWRAANVPN
eukprot:TRINITY_DN9893_c0_g1_i1.p1 TRINITY_DN9893_c0_g1~~TRINITY_DN9893_c0_g1_i1.p1  ORF type:complete len:398 (+),score=58.70 TRINITY_DN9893_c0_g1_i1:551-1744(+)